MTNDGVLSTAELLAVRDHVIMAVANDPSTQFTPPQTMKQVARAVEEVRKQVLHDLGVNAPSSPLTQLTTADAAWAWCISQRHYGQEMKDKYIRGLSYPGVKFNGRWSDGRPCGDGIWPSPDDFTREDLSMSCNEGNPNMIYLGRAIEKSRPQPTGMVMGGIYGGYYSTKKNGAHANTGVRISLDGGEFGHVYYDATPGHKFERSALRYPLTNSGSLDKVSVEMYLNSFVGYTLKDIPERMGVRPKGNCSGLFPLGENWPCFKLGNFAGFKDGNNGRTTRPGSDEMWMPFTRYRKANQPQISDLENAFRAQIQSKL